MTAAWRGVLVAVALAAGTGTAAEAPDLGAPEGAERTAHRVRSFDSYDLPLGVVGQRAAVTETVQGEVTWQAFRLLNPDASTAAIMSGYRARLAELGYEPAFACQTATCGGFDFRFHAAILPAPSMLLDVRDFAQFTAVRPDPLAYASILVSKVQDTVYIQTVAIVPGEAPQTVTDTPALSEETQVSTLPTDERDMLAQLMAEGHVPVDGLVFVQGGAKLSASSSEALDLLARLLTRDAALSVVIVGHSDNEGSLELNLDLSQRRAAAVRAALIARGVPQGQLEARGIAFLAPVTSNATAEGRTRNRRVELVLRQSP